MLMYFRPVAKPFSVEAIWADALRKVRNVSGGHSHHSRTLPRGLTQSWTQRVRLVFVYDRDFFVSPPFGGARKTVLCYPMWGSNPGQSVRELRHEPSELYGLGEGVDFKNKKIILCTGKNSIIYSDISVKLRHSSRNIESRKYTAKPKKTY